MKFATCCLNVHSLSTHQNTQSNVLSIFTNIGALIVGYHPRLLVYANLRMTIMFLKVNTAEPAGYGERNIM